MKKHKNSDGVNQYTKRVIAEFIDKKGHPLRSLWFRKKGTGASTQIIDDVMYCPKCDLFYKITFDTVRVEL